MKKMKIIGLYILSFVSALLASVIGVIFNAKLSQNPILMIAFAALAILPIFLLLFNIIFQKHLIKKINGINVAELNTFLVSHRNDAEKTAKEKLKELQHIRHLTTLYTVFIAILGITTAILGGVLTEFNYYLYTVCILYSAIILFSVFVRIRKKIPYVLDENIVTISQNDYPVIHALASKAAKSVGYEKEIVIIPEWDCSASIINDEKRAYLTIGVVLLNILTEEELYAILLHEFAHISKNSAVEREQQYNLWLCNERGIIDKLSELLSHLYSYSSVKYQFTYIIYQYAASVIKELNADRAMAKHFDSKIAVSALLKMHYNTLYGWERGVKNEDSIFKSEVLEANYLTRRIESLKESIATRSEFWNSLLSKEILANNASHPTLKMRMDALGVEKLSLTDSKSSEEYLVEIKKLLQFSEDTIYNNRIKTYEKERNENYSEPFARIEEWNNSGNPISAETYADIISDLKSVGKHEEAENLCDRVLEELPEQSTAHAAYMKGCAMICRYDEKGMDLIYHAMEQNGNYIEEGLNLLGEFCCLTGREDELLEYRKKAVQLAQRHKDQDFQISFLSKSDNLTKETLPDGMLEEILAYIKSIDTGIIQNIYLVRKTVSKTFFASVFIIHFYGGTDAQRDDIMHKIFRFLDSHPSEWQFALFDYFEYPEVNVEKIEGSLVYSKEDK